MKKYLTPSVRRWIYRVAIAAGAVAVFYGVLDAEAVPLLAALALALLNVTDDAE